MQYHVIESVRRLGRHGLFGLLFIACGWAALAAGPVQAQVVQRSFINSSFEVPRIGNNPNGCTRTIDDSLVTGWSTTENAGGAFNGLNPEACTDTTSFPPNPTSLSVIQLFLQNYQGANGEPFDTPARSGVQFAELNAQTGDKRLYQRVCLVQNETITWRLSHRGRGNSTVPDSMAFNIGPNPDGSGSALIVSAATEADGGGSILSCGAGGTCSRTVHTSGWADYSGTFTWNGAVSMQTIDFQSLGTSFGANSSTGNYLDDIQITLKPFLQFAGGVANVTYIEGGTAPVVSLQVDGNVPSQFSIPLTVSGTATRGTAATPAATDDYTLTVANATITVPAGDYGTGLTINLPLTFLSDAVIENNETIILTIPNSTSASPYILANTTACSGSAVNQLTINIIDNDIDLRTTKTNSTATPPQGAGNSFTYTVAYNNNTSPTTDPVSGARTTSHDVTAAISDLVPGDLTFASWTCASTGTAGTACPAASGSGAISGNAVLPAGGTITYTVTATVPGPTCATIQNTSSITTPSGFTESASVQSGFPSTAVPAGGAANNTASVSVTPQCTDLRMTKTSSPAGAVAVGQNITYTLLVENVGMAVTGAVVQDLPVSNVTCPAPAPASANVTCSASSGPACTSATYPITTLTGSGIVLGNMPSNSTVTLTFTCRVN